MKRLKLSPLWIDFILILLFSYTAFSKLMEQEMFVFQMKLSPLPLMPFLAPILAKTLPAAELLIVVLLLTDRWRKTGMLLSIALLGLFEIYIVWMLCSGLHLPCTCGGLMAKLSWKGHLAFNGLCMLLSYIAWRKSSATHPHRIFSASGNANRL